MNDYHPIDIPFNQRHTCWFCGEPSDQHSFFPNPKTKQNQRTELALQIPCCHECQTFSQQSDRDNVWEWRLHIKHQLMKKYAKHLAIGVNWSKEELEQTEFDGASFKGFKRSAWDMYQIAQQRVDYPGWELAIDGIPLDIINDAHRFEFDNKTFIHLNAAVEFYVQAEGLDNYLFSQLVDILGSGRLDYALKIARLNRKVSRRQADDILQEIELQQEEQREAEQIAQRESQLANTQLSSVTTKQFNVSSEHIDWAMTRGIRNLAQLNDAEDAFFDDHAQYGGVAAFEFYHNLQLYLQARQDPEWAKQHDPNQESWQALGK